MLKLHCDMCDKVIDNFYWQADRKSVSPVVHGIANIIGEYSKDFCEECFAMLLPTEERSET